MKLRLTLAALAAASAAFALDPLEKADACSTQLSPELVPAEGYFPIGVLGDHRFRLLPFAGLNLCETSHCCYEFKDGKPCAYRKAGNGKGLFFFNVWAAHTVYNSSETKHYGTIKRPVSDSGREYGRQMIRYFDPATRQYVLDAAAATVDSVMKQGDRGSVFIWGIDNEWEPPLDYSEEAVTAFRAFLEKAYGGDLSKLNRAWGETYKAFADAQPPKVAEYTLKPGAWLDWRRFQEEAYADFIRDYFKAIQERDPDHRAVVTKSTQCTIEMQSVVRNRALNHEILADRTRDLSKGWYGIDQYGHGDRNTYEMNYLYHCILPNDPAERKFRYGVFSGEANNHAGPGWQFAQSYWRLPSNGYKGGNFFVLGYFGAKNDYSTFGLTAPDGVRRSRFHYLTRYAAMIHRSEPFWAKAEPAAGVPRIAMLMPQRDILLANDTGVSRWDYSTNNRLSVYSHLRNAGYWVDVIPYGKLNPAFLKQYGALFLVGAEHLSPKECADIEAFVQAGGKLYSDMRAGSFDEHHLEARGLEKVLGLRHKGVYTGIEVSPDDVWYNTEYGNVIRGDGKILYETTTGKLLNAEDLFHNAKAAQVVGNDYGKGKSFWFTTRLGALRPESVEPMVVSNFFGGWLKRGGVKPAYAHSTAGGDRLRVEQPQMTADGNLAIAVAGATRFALPAGTLTVALPAAAKFTHAFWAPAESALLEKIAFTRTADGAAFALPEVKTAGILYCFTTPEPLLGIAVLNPRHAAKSDPATPELVPGETVKVKVQLANPGTTELAAGAVTLRAPADWKAEPAKFDTAALKPGELREFTFQVTIPESSAHFRPNFVYPLVAEFTAGGARTGVIHQSVGMRLDPKKFDHLLSDNATDGRFPRDFAIRTGAEYIYNFPEELPDGQYVKDPSSNKTPGRSGNGLTDGLDWWSRRVTFAMPEAEVVFDLKSAYEVTAVNLRKGAPAFPNGIEVEVSEDGKSFRTVAKAPKPDWDEGGWTMVKTEPAKGRYVLVRIKYPTAKGGYLDELEIYGRPLK